MRRIRRSFRLLRQAHRRRGDLRLIAACLVMLFAVVPHLTAMAMPMHHAAAPLITTDTADDMPDHRQAAEQAKAEHGASKARPSGLPCCAWSCGTLGAIAFTPEATPLRSGRRLTAVAVRAATGISIEPGERPPRIAAV